MIVVKVELWPHGDRDQAKQLGMMRLWNDGTGTADRGNYKAALYSKTDYKNVSRKMSEAELKDWPRKRMHVWDLVQTMLGKLRD